MTIESECRSSILDAHLLQPSEDFNDLPETYVIFITENDVIGGNQPIYTIERQIINMGQPFNDGEHIIYVNGANKDSVTELGKLMHDFFCTNPDDMNFKQLADKVRCAEGKTAKSIPQKGTDPDLYEAEKKKKRSKIKLKNWTSERKYAIIKKISFQGSRIVNRSYSDNKLSLLEEPDTVSTCTLGGYGIGIRPDLFR